MTVRMRAPATDREWHAYHAIRRRVLFELRGNGAEYDAQHPDEHRPGHHPFVLWDGETPVGVIRIDIATPTATFRRVAIREDAQRRGYGRQLLGLAEQFAKSQHCEGIVSHVDPDAVGFYERCGFVHLPGAPSGTTIPMAKSLVASR